LLAAESLFTPANDGMMPKWLTHQNAHGVPAHALWLTNGMVQAFLLLTLFSNASYLALISLSTAMILVPYLFSAAFGLWVAWRSDGLPSVGTAQRGAMDIPVAALATVYCLWLLYAAGPKYLLLSAVLYAPGAALFFWARRERAQTAFTGPEQFVLGALLLVSAGAIFMLANGTLSL